MQKHVSKKLGGEQQTDWSVPQETGDVKLNDNTKSSTCKDGKFHHLVENGTDKLSVLIFLNTQLQGLWGISNLQSIKLCKDNLEKPLEKHCDFWTPRWHHDSVRRVKPPSRNANFSGRGLICDGLMHSWVCPYFTHDGRCVLRAKEEKDHPDCGTRVCLCLRYRQCRHINSSELWLMGIWSHIIPASVYVWHNCLCHTLIYFVVNLNLFQMRAKNEIVNIHLRGETPLRKKNSPTELKD